MVFKRIATITAIAALAVCAVLSMSACEKIEPVVETVTEAIGGSDEAYVPASKSAAVTSPAIAQDGVLRVGVNTDNPPLAGQASTIVGIDVDVAAALADEMGLKVEIVDVGDGGVAALQNGTVDVVLGIEDSESDEALWKSDAYLPTGVALFANAPDAGVPNKEAGPFLVAAQSSSLSAWAVSNEYGDEYLLSEGDLKSAFNDLASGAANYVAADAIIGTYAAHTGDVAAFVTAMMQQPSGYCAGVLASNAELQAAVNQAMSSLVDGGVVKLIAKKWLGTSLDLSMVPLTAGAQSGANIPNENATKVDATSTDENGEYVNPASEEAQAPAEPAPEPVYEGEPTGYYDEWGNWIEG